jgi:hypothetical protein
MTRSRLHKHIKASVRSVISSRHQSGIRFVLESGSAEGFLRDLLAIELKAHGHRGLIREAQKNSGKVDLVLKEAPPEYIEAKQLHLKDGAQFVENIVSDLSRYTGCRCFGVVYLVDERKSRFKMKCPSFHLKNRAAKHEISEVTKALPDNFRKVYPSTEKQARVRRFKWDGRLDLYAWVVEQPKGFAH